MYLRTNVKLLCFVNVSLCCVFAVYIENNAYKGVTVVFSPSIQENQINTTKLQKIIQKSSELLYRATRRRAFFSEVDLLYPSRWASIYDPHVPAGIVKPQRISVYVTNSDKDGETSLRTQHSRGCGEKGEIIYMSPAWLSGDEEELSREFVRQWAIYRYGVFEEERERGDWPCFTTDGEHWFQSGCYNINVNNRVVIDSEGLPFCDTKEISGHMRSSLMSTAHVSSITDFCDGSKSLPHSPVAPTRHNRICRGKPVWSVIKESVDFKYGRNLPRKEDSAPSVSFRCFQEAANHLIFSIQTHSTEDVERIVTDLRLSLLRFLLFDAPEETQVSVITFHEKAESPIHLNLTEPSAVYDDLNAKVRALGIVPDVCLHCGLQGAFDLSRRSESRNPSVVLVVFASALRSHNMGQLISLMESSPTATHVIIIEDTEEVFTASNLVKAIRRTGGDIFTTPSSKALLVTKLSMFLTTVFRNPLSIQDNVAIIHQASFFNINSTVTDVVEADSYLQGDMTYTVICDAENRLTPSDVRTVCSPLPDMREMATKISCSYTAKLEEENDTRKWTFSFRDEGGISPLSCSSIATVQLRANAADLLTVRGWLNIDTFEADERGRDALIIYTEIMRGSTPVAKAEVHAAVYSSSNRTPTVIQLLDTGNGDPDMKKEDGIYSRYFINIRERGIHSVIIHAKGEVANNELDTISRNQVIFSRVVPVGSFLVTEQPKNIDYYPPNRIGDLRVTGIDHINSVVTLQWTAPGDNYDHGTANRYNLKFSQTRSDLEESTFEIGNSANLGNFSPNMTIFPSGNLQIGSIQLLVTRKNTPYYIAIRTTNKNNDTSLVSNIVQIPISKFIPVQTTQGLDESTGPPDGFVSTRSDVNISEPGNVTDLNTEQNTAQTTEVPRNNSNNSTEPAVDLSTAVEPTTNNSTTETSIADRNGDPCDKRYIITLASAVAGGTILLILIVNVIICICFKKHEKPRKQLSRKASLRPPYNMTIAPRETPAAMNDYEFSNPHGNFREDLQDFEVDSDYTFVPGNQRLKNKEQNYSMIATAMQESNANFRSKPLTRRYEIPEDDSMTGSVPSTLASTVAIRKRSDKEDNAGAYAVSLGLV